MVYRHRRQHKSYPLFPRSCFPLGSSFTTPNSTNTNNSLCTTQQQRYRICGAHRVDIKRVRCLSYSLEVAGQNHRNYVNYNDKNFGIHAQHSCLLHFFQAIHYIFNAAKCACIFFPSEMLPTEQISAFSIATTCLLVINSPQLETMALYPPRIKLG